MAKAEDKNWVMPEHSGFEAPAYGEVKPVGSTFQDVDGNVHLVTEHGDKIIRKA